MLEENTNIPGPKARVAIEDNDHQHPSETNVRTPWLVPGVVWQLVSFEALDETSVVEADVGDRNHDVVDHTARGDQTDEPIEHFSGGTADLQQGQQWEDGDEYAGVERSSVACCSGENPRCSTLLG